MITIETWQLQQLQGLPLEVKIIKTKERIREWYEYWNGQVYVSFSGGKDSTALLHIVRQMYPDVEAVFVDTGLEYPEIRDFVKTFYNVTWLKPKKNFRQVLSEKGYPVVSKKYSRFIRDLQKDSKNNAATRNLRLTGYNRKGVYCSSQILPMKWRYLIDAPFKCSEECCDIMKKEPFHRYQRQSGKYPIMGVIAEESSEREKQYKKYGCNAFDVEDPSSKPLSFWKNQDILEYFKRYNIPYCSIYGDIVPIDQVPGQESLPGTIENLICTGCQRTGCMFCMFGVHLEQEPNRFQMMKETHPKQYDYCINNLGLGKVMDYIGVKY